MNTMEQTERQASTLGIDKGQVYTMKELQPILKCSKNHIYSMAAKGEIPVIRLGKKIVCDPGTRASGTFTNPLSGL